MCAVTTVIYCYNVSSILLTHTANSAIIQLMI